MASLKVIGTGFGRTGTDSMREALEILGLQELLNNLLCEGEK
jgi:hypothetical protein